MSGDEKVLGTQSPLACKSTSTHCIPYPSFIKKSSIHTCTHKLVLNIQAMYLNLAYITLHHIAYHLIQASNHTYLLWSSHNIISNSYSTSPSHVHLKQTCMFILICMHLPHYITTTPRIQMHDMWLCMFMCSFKHIQNPNHSTIQTKQINSFLKKRGLIHMLLSINRSLSMHLN